MRQDEPTAEVNASVLPDLLSALMNQWEGEAAESVPEAKIGQLVHIQDIPKDLCESATETESALDESTLQQAIHQLDDKLNFAEAYQAESAFDEFTTQPAIHQLDDELSSVEAERAETALDKCTTQPTILETEDGLDTFLSQLNAQYDEVNSAEAERAEPALDDSTIQQAIHQLDDELNFAEAYQAETALDESTTQPAILEIEDGLDSLLSQLNAQYDEVSSAEAHEAETALDEYTTQPARLNAECEEQASGAAALEPSPDDTSGYALDTLLAKLNADDSAPQSAVATETETALSKKLLFDPTVDRKEGAKQRYIQFWMAEESFAIPIGQVLESGRLTDIAPLPCVNDAIRGLINLHGEIVPLLDLRIILGNIHGDCPAEERMLIVRTGNSEGACGLAVDRISGILALEPNELRSISPAEMDLAGAFVNGFCARQDSLIRLFDLERLFDNLSGKVAHATEPIQDQPGRS